MATAQTPLDILKGESRTFRTTIRDSTGALVDLSTATAIEFQVKDADGDSDPPLISKSIGSGITLVGGGTGGQFDIALDPSDTSSSPDLAIKTFRYDVVVVLSTGARHYVIPPSDFTVVAVVNQP